MEEWTINMEPTDWKATLALDENQVWEFCKLLQDRGVIRGDQQAFEDDAVLKVRPIEKS